MSLNNRLKSCMNYVTFWPVLTRTSLAGFNAPIDTACYGYPFSYTLWFPSECRLYASAWQRPTSTPNDHLGNNQQRGFFCGSHALSSPKNCSSEAGANARAVVISLQNSHGQLRRPSAPRRRNGLLLLWRFFRFRGGRRGGFWLNKASTRLLR